MTVSDKPGKVLITGGTGLVGSHLAERLLALGYSVRCLLRYPDRRRWLGDLPVEVAPGDITVPSTLPQAVDGVDAVVHAAALTKAKSPKEYYLFNAIGTRNLLEACVDAPSPPRRFVFCSSQAAVGPTLLNRPRTAQDPPNPITDYGNSKLEAECEITRFSDKIETVIIRPTAVFGPRDRDIFIYFKTMAKWRIKPIFGSSQNMLSSIYVKDLIEILIKALSVPGDQLPSQPLFAADPKPCSWAEITSLIEKSLGYRCITVVFPAFMVMLFASISELFAGKKPSPFNRQKAREMLASSWWCDVQPTINQLKWNSITPLDEAIRATVEWYREQSWIK